MRTLVCRFLVGAFAGALASFFPRLVAVLGGDPNENVELFSHTYLLVGGIVALVVAIAVVIIETAPDRPLRDVFMTALGVPTMLMGALTTSATTQNANLADRKIEAISRELAAKTEIPIRNDVLLPAPASATPLPGARIGWLDGFVPTAHAQTGPAQRAQNNLGIALREPRYVTVYQEARDEASLRAMQQGLARRGIDTRTVQLSDGRHLLVDDGPARAYSDAVLQGARAQAVGAAPYLIPAPR